MLANSATRRTRLAISYRNPRFDSRSRSLSHGSNSAHLAEVPAMPDALLLLQVLLSAPVVNLNSAAEAIRGDIGLTIQLLNSAGWRHSAEDVSISKNVVLLGLRRLRTLTAKIDIISTDHRGRSGLRACDRFWAHSRLTALMAEELAPGLHVDPEQAYLAGMLHRLGELPNVLGWTTDSSDLRVSEQGDALARRWHFPELLREVIRGDERACSPEAKQLLKLVQTADQQASRIEGLVAKYAQGVF